MTLVLDANVALWACGADARFDSLGDELVAPWLLWSEFSSALHAAVWRREISSSNADATLARLEASPLKPRAPKGLRREAWRIADELGWAKTYDAEYVALASLLDFRLVTLDGRLHRGAKRLGFVVGLHEL